MKHSHTLHINAKSLSKAYKKVPAEVEAALQRKAPQGEYPYIRCIKMNFVSSSCTYLQEGNGQFEFYTTWEIEYEVEYEVL